MKKTNVYVDAFNLYYGCLKGTPYRWLDIRKLCEVLLPKNDIQRIRVFLARVNARPSDPGQPQRQQAYIRALLTIPGLTVHEGRYLTTTKTMKLAHPVPGLPTFVDVIKTEEKGSDVNLATMLLCDGYENDYEAAAVISNDSDLVFPIEIARTKFNVPLLVLNPYKHPSAELQRVASIVKPIRQGALAACQFPPQLQDANGIITKPASW